MFRIYDRKNLKVVPHVYFKNGKNADEYAKKNNLEAVVECYVVYETYEGSDDEFTRHFSREETLKEARKKYRSCIDTAKRENIIEAREKYNHRFSSTLTFERYIADYNGDGNILETDILSLCTITAHSDEKIDIRKL